MGSPAGCSSLDRGMPGRIDALAVVWSQPPKISTGKSQNNEQQEEDNEPLRLSW
jgi:hypothetical protein